MNTGKEWLGLTFQTNNSLIFQISQKSVDKVLVSINCIDSEFRLPPLETPPSHIVLFTKWGLFSKSSLGVSPSLLYQGYIVPEQPLLYTLTYTSLWCHSQKVHCVAELPSLHFALHSSRSWENHAIWHPTVHGTTVQPPA